MRFLLCVLLLFPSVSYAGFTGVVTVYNHCTHGNIGLNPINYSLGGSKNFDQTTLASGASYAQGSVYDQGTATFGIYSATHGSMTSPSFSGGTTTYHYDPDNAMQPTYYMSGCITNNTGFVVSYGFKFSDGTANANSGPILPNGVWCYSKTNVNSRFTYQGYRTVYNSDGGTNDWFITDPYSAWTNSVPGQGGSGSALDQSTQVPLQPGSGQGNNSALTGDQYSKGVKSILDALWQGFQNLIGAQRNNPVVVNVPTNNTPDYSGLLSQIQTNTDDSYHAANLANMHLAYMETNIAKNTYALDLMNTNLAEIKTNTGILRTNSEWAKFGPFTNNLAGEFFSNGGYDGIKSNIYASATGASNGLYSAYSSNGWAFDSITNISDAATAPSFWVIPGFYKSVQQRQQDQATLDPTVHVIFTEMCKWLKICFTWLIAIGCVYYIRWAVQQRTWVYYQTPGGGPGKGTFSWLTWGTSLLIDTGMVAAIPVILGAALNTVLVRSGVGSGPLSAATINSIGGGYGTAINVGIQLIKEAFPLTYALGILVYLWAFDATLDAFLAYGRRLKHGLGN